MSQRGAAHKNKEVVYCIIAKAVPHKQEWQVTELMFLIFHAAK